MIFSSLILEQRYCFFDIGYEVSAKSGEVNPVTMGACIHPAVDDVSLNFLNEMNDYELNRFFFQVDFDSGMDFVVNDF